MPPGAALLRLRDQPFDAEAIASLVPGTAATQKGVAAAFGMSPNTVSGSWANAGMPGTKGSYSLAEIARWRLQHLAEVERSRRSVEDLDDAELKRRHAEAEARKMELQADRLEREEQQAVGNLVRRDDVTAAMHAIINAFSEHLDGLPDQIAPMLPVANAAEITEDVRGLIKRMLKGFSEQSARDVVRGNDL